MILSHESDHPIRDGEVSADLQQKVIAPAQSLFNNSSGNKRSDVGRQARLEAGVEQTL
jgi:hypothetical protein